MKTQILIVLLVISLAACAPAPDVPANIQNTAIALAYTGFALTQTALPTVAPTATVVVILPTPIPTQPPPPIFTPDAIQVERWKEYQMELAKVLFSFPPPERKYDPEEYKKAICEWDILGRSGQEVYVLAVCASTDGLWHPTNPAVIYLKLDGSIREVKISRMEYPRQSQPPIYDLHLFPINVQEKLCLYYFQGIVPQCSYITPDYVPYFYLQPREGVLISHLKYREGRAEEPPLVILSAMQMATPTP